MKAKIMKTFMGLSHLTLVMLAVLSFASAPSYAGESANISITNAWARASVMVGGNGGGFFSVENKGSTPDVLLRAEADVSEIVELHTMTMDGNIMRMRKLDEVDLPAHGKLLFAPGGNHVMFIKLKAPLKEGESFPITLVFKQAGSIKVMMAVQNKAPAPTSMSEPGSMEDMH